MPALDEQIVLLCNPKNTCLIGSEGNHMHRTVTTLHDAWFSGNDFTNHAL